MIPSRNDDDQRILEFYWTSNTCHTHPKVEVFRCYLLLMIISIQKIKDIGWFFLGCCWSNNPAIQWTRGTTSHTKPKVVVSVATFLWWLTPHIKININWFFQAKIEKNKRILQSNWAICLTGQTQPKVVVLDATSITGTPPLPIPLSFFLEIGGLTSSDFAITELQKLAPHI